jgi:hypothetical protein
MPRKSLPWTIEAVNLLNIRTQFAFFCSHLRDADVLAVAQFDARTKCNVVHRGNEFNNENPAIAAGDQVSIATISAA